MFSRGRPAKKLPTLPRLPIRTRPSRAHARFAENRRLGHGRFTRSPNFFSPSRTREAADSKAAHARGAGVFRSRQSREGASGGKRQRQSAVRCRCHAGWEALAVVELV